MRHVAKTGCPAKPVALGRPESGWRRHCLPPLALIFVLALTPTASPPVFAQCPASLTMPIAYYQAGGVCGITGGMLHRVNVPSLSYCMVTMATNVQNCSVRQMGPITTMIPTGTGSITITLVPATFDIYGRNCSNTGKPPLCQFSCPCGTVTWSPATNLPVELMDFSVDFEEGDESADVDQPTPDGESDGDGDA